MTNYFIYIEKILIIFLLSFVIGNLLALLLGEPFLAEAALEMGFISRIVPPSEAAALAQRQARKLAVKPLSSLIETKRLMKKGQVAIVAERMAEEGASFGRLLREPAAQQAFGAFMQKHGAPKS